MASVRAISIFRAQALVGGIFVDHRVHAAWRNAEEQSRTAKLLEVAIVAVPVGLWHNGHTQPLSFKGASYNGRSKRRVVYVGIAGKENDIGLVPTAYVHLFAGGGQPVGKLIVAHYCAVSSVCVSSVCVSSFF